MNSHSFLIVFLAASLAAQSEPRSKPDASMVIKAARLLDVRKGSYLDNAAVWIAGERINQVGRASEVEAQAPKDARIIDLGRATILPGFIDCHTHIMARFDPGPDGYFSAWRQNPRPSALLRAPTTPASRCRRAIRRFVTSRTKVPDTPTWLSVMQLIRD
jgi:imidazolonepropionase-like amidohydrolase